MGTYIPKAMKRDRNEIWLFASLNAKNIGKIEKVLSTSVDRGLIKNQSRVLINTLPGVPLVHIIRKNGEKQLTTYKYVARYTRY